MKFENKFRYIFGVLVTISFLFLITIQFHFDKMYPVLSKLSTSHYYNFVLTPQKEPKGNTDPVLNDLESIKENSTKSSEEMELEQISRSVEFELNKIFLFLNNTIAKMLEGQQKWPEMKDKILRVKTDLNERELRLHQDVKDFEYSFKQMFKLNSTPTIDYEVSKRYLRRDLKEAHWYINKSQSILQPLPIGRTGDNNKGWPEMNQEFFEATTKNIFRIHKSDGFEPWRKKETEDLSRLIQSEIYELQNPRNCNEARKLKCNFKKGGFGASVHHPMLCLILAFRVVLCVGCFCPFAVFSPRYVKAK